MVPPALNRETLLADFAQIDLGVLITVVVAVQPVLALSPCPPCCWPGGS